jgi:hypothetical protein
VVLVLLFTVMLVLRYAYDVGCLLLVADDVEGSG